VAERVDRAAQPFRIEHAGLERNPIAAAAESRG
jgi:hypothetical protein